MSQQKKVEPRPAARHRLLSMRSRRVGTWGLVLLGGLLVLDGPVLRVGGESDSDLLLYQTDGVRAAIRVALVAHLSHRRSSLSDEEQHRVIEAVLRSSRRYELDPFLVIAVLLVESDARPWAVSEKGAIGLMQVMPYMAEKLPLAGNLATIESNVDAGCFILADNIRRLGEPKGISSYFWGRHIRGVAYLEKVQETRARVREASHS